MEGGEVPPSAEHHGQNVIAKAVGRQLLQGCLGDGGEVSAVRDTASFSLFDVACNLDWNIIESCGIFWIWDDAIA